MNSNCFQHASEQIISTNIMEAYETTQIENSITSI